MKRTGWVLMFVLLAVICVGIMQGNTAPPENTKQFISRYLPKGFDFQREPEFYGTYDKELPNGTIYTYMNGGGEVYIGHGFEALTHIRLADDQGHSITLNLFNMGNTKNASAAFADEAICPPGYKEMNIGVTAKTYAFAPDFFLYFIKGEYVVYLAIDDDTMSKTLLDFAKNIYLNLYKLNH